MRLDHESCQVMKFVYIRTTCSVAIQNMGLKLILNVMKQLVFILLYLYLICAEYEFKTFGSTSDQIRLMAFCLHIDVIDVGPKTIHSISDKIPSGESWNYLSRMLSYNIEDLTPSTPFRDLILATNLCQGSDGLIRLCVLEA